MEALGSTLHHLQVTPQSILTAVTGPLPGSQGESHVTARVPRLLDHPSPVAQHMAQRHEVTQQDGAGNVGLLSQSGQPQHQQDRRKRGGSWSFLPFPFSSKQAVLCALGVPGTSLASSMPEALSALAVLGSWKWPV